MPFHTIAIFCHALTRFFYFCNDHNLNIKSISKVKFHVVCMSKSDLNLHYLSTGTLNSYEHSWPPPFSKGAKINENQSIIKKYFHFPSSSCLWVRGWSSYSLDILQFCSIANRCSQSFLEMDIVQFCYVYVDIVFSFYFSILTIWLFEETKGLKTLRKHNFFS